MCVQRDRESACEERKKIEKERKCVSREKVRQIETECLSVGR